MRSTGRFLSVLAWDGILPVLVASAPAVVLVAFPGSELATLIAVLLMPMIAAMIRASVGLKQIARVCGGMASLERQVALSLAIVLLLFFEGAVGVVTLTKGMPDTAWWFPAGFYTAYLAVLMFALRPTSARFRRSDSGQRRNRLHQAVRPPVPRRS